MLNQVKIIQSIIDHQQLIIGPLAVEQAKKVSGIEIDDTGKITVSKINSGIIKQLVDEYAKLFGQASIEACKDAVREINPPVPVDELPEILK